MSEEPKPPPGWYAHPSMANTLRYWDGEQWRDQIAPAHPPAQQVSTTKIARGVALGVAVVVAGVVVIYGITSADDELDCSKENADRVTSGLPAKDC